MKFLLTVVFLLKIISGSSWSLNLKSAADYLMPANLSDTNVALVHVGVDKLNNIGGRMINMTSNTTDIGQLTGKDFLNMAINAAADETIIDEAINSGTNMGRAVKESLPGLFGDTDTIWTSTKELLTDVPVKVLFKTINQVCSIALTKNAIVAKVTPDINKLGLVLIRPKRNVTISLTRPEELWSNPLFNRTFNTTIFITGWLTDLTDGRDISVDTVYKAYVARGNYNFIVLDSARFIATLYEWSAFNTEEIGRALGQALAKLMVNYPLRKIHLIGHSLGAHICGATGRYFTALTSKTLPHITGLDPANPCFNEGEELTGLYRGDADFIDVIHTNNGALGKREPIGDVDFYPNGIVVLQPGCQSAICAHSRAWALYAETVYPGNENNFIGTRCNSMLSLRANMCPTRKAAMGFAVPRNVRGNYFLSTKDSYPYGEFARGSKK